MDNGDNPLNLNEVTSFGYAATTNSTAPILVLIGTWYSYNISPSLLGFSKIIEQSTLATARESGSRNLASHHKLPRPLLQQEAQGEERGGERGHQRHVQQLLRRPGRSNGDDRQQRLLCWGQRL